MIREETASSDFVSDYSEGIQDAGSSSRVRSISRSFRLMLFMSLLQGFSERQFFDMLLFGHAWKHPVDHLNSEWMLFSQRLVGCVGFVFWSVACSYLRPSAVLGLSFMAWGLGSLLQSLASSFLTLLLCRYLVSFSYGALEPSVQVISTGCQLKTRDLAKMFGAVSCYKGFGSFVSIATSTMIHLSGDDEEVVKTYSRAVWIITGGISILVSAFLLASMYLEYRDLGQESVLFSRDKNAQDDSVSGDKTTIACIYLAVFVAGLLANIIGEVYSFYQITSSLSFVRRGHPDAYVLSLNLTYYALSSVVFLFGSAIGSLSFGITYGRVYGLAKRAKERFEIDSVAGLGRKGSINVLCLTSASAVGSLLLGLLLVQFVFEIPSIARFAVAEVAPESLGRGLGWIFPHLVAVFLLGALLLPALEIFPRFQLVTLAQPSRSAVSYGLYLVTARLLSDPSLYKYLRLFSKDDSFKVSISGDLSLNVVPLAFHGPVKALFPARVISRLRQMDFPLNYVHFQELQMASSIYSILLYACLSSAVALLLLVRLTGVCGGGASRGAYLSRVGRKI